MKDVLYFFSQIWEWWAIKVPLSTVAVFYSEHLGGDAALLMIFSGMIAVDLALGTWLAIKKRRFDYHMFARWVVKVGTHFAVILIVGLAIRSILEPLSIEFPLLDLFLGMLICTEALSVLKNMRRLGLPVPRLAVRLLSEAQEAGEQKAADFFSQPEHDRRKRPECGGGDDDGQN